MPLPNTTTDHRANGPDLEALRRQGGPCWGVRLRSGPGQFRDVDSLHWATTATQIALEHAKIGDSSRTFVDTPDGRWWLAQYEAAGPGQVRITEFDPPVLALDDHEER